MSSRARTAIIVLVLFLLVLACAAGALLVGVADTTSTIVMQIRAPRVVLAVVVGAGLGMAGALLQGTFRNPLADPGIVGVSAGAALGAVVIVAFGASYGGVLAAIGACIGGLAAMAAVAWIARDHGRTEVVTLVLGGVAITAFASAIVSVVIAGSGGTRSAVFWTTGSLALATWPGVVATVPFVVVGIALAIVVARPLDVMSLGDRSAWAAGVPVERTRILAMAGAVLLVSAGVAVVGVIAFIGLVVPHIVRLLMGPSHGRLLVGSALTGALLMLIADTIARTVVAPVELPIGIVTAVIGAPIFIVLILRTRAAQGGWA